MVQYTVYIIVQCLFFPQDADNHGDPNCDKGSVLDNADDKTENEEVSVSGLINSDGEEENWKPIIIGKWQQIRSDDNIFKLL